MSTMSGKTLLGDRLDAMVHSENRENLRTPVLYVCLYLIQELLHKSEEPRGSPMYAW